MKHKTIALTMKGSILSILACIFFISCNSQQDNKLIVRPATELGFGEFILGASLSKSLEEARLNEEYNNIWQENRGGIILTHLTTSIPQYDYPDIKQSASIEVFSYDDRIYSIVIEALDLLDMYIAKYGETGDNLHKKWEFENAILEGHTIYHNTDWPRHSGGDVYSSDMIKYTDKEISMQVESFRQRQQDTLECQRKEAKEKYEREMLYKDRQRDSMRKEIPIKLRY